MSPRLFQPSLVFQVAMLLGLSGCVTTEQVGRDFPRPEDAPGITIGRSTEPDVLAIYGQPAHRNESGRSEAPDPKTAGTFRPYVDSTLVFQNGIKHTIGYAAPGVTPTSVQLRIATFQFHDGVLSGYSFRSAFPDENRSFDADAAKAMLTRPDLTLEELTRAIGPPESRQTFPAAAASKPVVEVDNWNSASRNAAGRSAVSQSLSVYIGLDGRIVRHNLSETIAP